MLLRQQLLLGALLLLVTGVAIHNIAEARNEAAVGGRVVRLEASRPAEMAALGRILGMIEGLGQADFAARLRELQAEGGLWSAQNLGAEHWALYVDTFGVVRRIYVRAIALRLPEAHLFPDGDPSIPPDKRRAFASVGLAGALFHELQHWEGADEKVAYDREIAWLEVLPASLPPNLSATERDALEWGIESATLSARKARALALARGAL